MHHPFLDIQQLREMKLEDLQLRISELHKKLNQAYSMHNRALIHQVGMVLESYTAAYNEQIAAALEKRNLNKNVKVEVQKT